jgi:hypothetical protein
VTVNAFACPEITIEVGLSNLNCFGVCDGTISIISINGGTEPYAYLWSDGSTGEVLDGLCSGEYFLTVTDANGCSVVEQYEIFEPEQMLVNGGSTDESAEDANDGTAWAAPTGGVEPYSYEWNNGATDSLLTDLQPGIYYVSVTDANGCSSAQVVIVNPFGCVLEIEATIVATCSNTFEGSIELITISGTDPIDYLWYDGSTQGFLVDLCAGTYSVTVTDGDGCFFLGSYTIGELEAVAVTAESTDETGTGLNDGTAWALPQSGVAPYTYEWSNGSMDSLITDLAPGTYFVTMTDANGCSDIGETTIIAFECVVLTVNTMQEVSCHGGCDGALSVSVVGGVGPFLYLWSTGDTTQLIEGLCADTYTVLVTDDGLACNTLVSFELTQPDFIDGDVDEVVHITDSTEASISISIFGGTPPYTYDWHSYFGSFSSEDEDISGMPADVYFVIVTDANGCSFDLDSIYIFDFTVGTKEIPTLDVRVYPNPASTQLTFQVPTTGSFTGNLITNEGRVLRSWNNTTTVDIRDIAAGVYTIQIISGAGNYTGRLAIIQ